ncbi:hypothetical protein PHET_05876 [Paragonimus heterotremus]|uniref:Uncharacterized protein n=1 Tax=Paragonimus heterotremus TaxID=100268 RepID=A0A8J4TER8_9TREM|nr:hypothetical protein PHET_05876 [Paragonimus heterotremus]
MRAFDWPSIVNQSVISQDVRDKKLIDIRMLSIGLKHTICQLARELQQPAHAYNLMEHVNHVGDIGHLTHSWDYVQSASLKTSGLATIVTKGWAGPLQNTTPPQSSAAVKTISQMG